MDAAYSFLRTYILEICGVVVATISISLFLFYRPRLKAKFFSLGNVVAMSAARFVAYGFRLWAEHETGDDELESRRDDLWNWIGDQVFASQKKHAFSVGCIVFRKADSGIETLFVRRKFKGFDDRVYLWPGGRVRGLQDGSSLPEVIKDFARREASCEVNLVSSIGEPEQVWSLDADRKPNIRNEIDPPPFLIMRQNRPQRNGIPGHIDLIFIAEFRNRVSEDGVGYETVWMNIDDVKGHKEPWILWPDTKLVVVKAAEWYAKRPAVGFL